MNFTDTSRSDTARMFDVMRATLMEDMHRKSEEWLRGHADHLDCVREVEVTNSIEWPTNDHTVRRLICLDCAGVKPNASFAYTITTTEPQPREPLV